MVVPVSLSHLLVKLIVAHVRMLLCVFRLEVLYNLVKGILACMFVKCLLGYIIHWLIQFFVDSAAEFLVIDLMVILALNVLA